MKNSKRMVVLVAMTLGACGGPTLAEEKSAVTSARLEIAATTPAPLGTETQLPVVAWEVSVDYAGDADLALQDLTAAGSAADRWQLTQTPPAAALEQDDELLLGSFSLGYLALAPAGHEALVSNSFGEEDGAAGAPVQLVARNYAVIYMSQPQPARSFVAGYYNGYHPLGEGLHLIHFREPTADEARQAAACLASASVASLADVNAKFHASYADEDTLYEESGLEWEAQQARLSLYELALDTHRIESACAISRAVGEEQPLGASVELRAERDEELVNWD